MQARESVKGGDGNEKRDSKTWEAVERCTHTALGTD